jgi:hypothetical protein
MRKGVNPHTIVPHTPHLTLCVPHGIIWLMAEVVDETGENTRKHGRGFHFRPGGSQEHEQLERGHVHRCFLVSFSSVLH